MEKRSLIRKQLSLLQKSYSEAFSVHGLTRIIHSGWKERILWCLFFLTAVIGLAFMSSNIIKAFYNKEVRTEVRIEQHETQRWPSITICSKAVIIQHLNCFDGIFILDPSNSEFCSMHLRPLEIIPYWDESEPIGLVVTKEGCAVINSNGTLTHEKRIKRSKIYIRVDDLDYYRLGFLSPLGISLFFYEGEMARNSSHAFYIQDLDVEHGFHPPGSYEYLLEKTKIVKKGLPFNSNCTKNLTIEDRNRSKYSYPACMDQGECKRSVKM